MKCLLRMPYTLETAIKRGKSVARSMKEDERKPKGCAEWWWWWKMLVCWLVFMWLLSGWCIRSDGCNSPPVEQNGGYSSYTLPAPCLNICLCFPMHMNSIKSTFKNTAAEIIAFPDVICWWRRAQVSTTETRQEWFRFIKMKQKQDKRCFYCKVKNPRWHQLSLTEKQGELLKLLAKW